MCYNVQWVKARDAVQLPRMHIDLKNSHNLKVETQVLFWKTLAPWKKSYEKPTQHIKKQRYYFTDKGPSCQSYGFPSSHVWK